MDTFKTRQEFDDLINLTDVKGYGNIRFKEIAEINSYAATQLRSLDLPKNLSLPAIRDDYRIKALDSYLSYLQTQGPNSRKPEIATLREKSLEAMKELFQLLKSSQPKLYDKKNVILEAAKNQDRGKIEKYRDIFDALKIKSDVAGKI